MCELFVVGYEVGYIDIAVVPFDENVLSNLISKIQYEQLVMESRTLAYL